MARAQPSGFDLDRLLRPRSVAIVGASASAGALGASVLENLLRGGFSGDIHLINPKRTEIAGRACLASVEDLPNGVDAAVLAIPKAGVLDALAALVRKQVGGAVIFSAGFAEGGEAGRKEQREITRLAREARMAVMGPNCLGFVNNIDGVALTFVQTPAAQLGEGPLAALISQSGAMAAVLATNLAGKDLPVTLSVSTGNEASTGVEDYVAYVLKDGRADVIGMIVEQFRDPPRFLTLAEQARAAGKTIVLLHPGRSAAARASAATHTGAMAGDYAVMRTLVERAGVIVAETVEELSDLIEIVARGKPPKTSGAAMLTESGAFKALTLDLAEQVGLALPALSDTDSPALRAALPPFVPVSNPVDLTAQPLVDPELYGRAIAALLEDDRIGAILLGIIQTDAATCALKLPAIIEALKRNELSKPIIYAGLDDGAVVPAQYLHAMRELGASCIPTAERAVRALARLGVRSDAGTSAKKKAGKRPALDLPAEAGVVPEYKCKAVLRAAGVRFPEGELATSVAAAVAAAEKLGFPVALKAQSSALAHKTEAGGVLLNVDSAAAVELGWATIQANVESYAPGLKLDGVLIERMAAKGIEMILGAKRDSLWGPVVLLGFGGVQAEVLKDFRVMPPDLSASEIEAEILRLRGAPLLTGFRGAERAAIGALAETAAVLGQLMLQEPRIMEIDLNPLVVGSKAQGVTVLDALMLLES
jgi:acyl-CoA synthetase (NDP forming)